ncbi:hypothetical protein GGR51DRAFT_577645 [Nemania sp. FL0031]|nr:hypothetical protein GGR51DRAFT_577645 [Nemania sp. FL0031]
MSSFLETLQNYYHARTHPRYRWISIIEPFFQLKPGALHRLARKYGTEAIQTTLFFRDLSTTLAGISKADVEQTLEWFELIRAAITNAHNTWRHIENSDLPNVGNSTYELYRFTFIEAAFLAYQKPITSDNSAGRIKSRLMRLAKSIISYKTVGLEYCEMHYYAACVLIVSLLVPLAPYFAEECWGRLIFGDRWNELYEPSNKIYNYILGFNPGLAQDIKAKMEPRVKGSQPPSIFNWPFSPKSPATF